ncbi:hypothetical protein LLEC1_02891 [Akanthomyces lecanii]|uniref:SWIRM domain-containing protein n=1 Tax=Cordyceps confragosa TaxID=2714763 RepID=A0A179I0Y9_CORDF|nr:hypothetical protein LLEC1_02891 [Akanthomyces lecanii]
MATSMQRERPVAPMAPPPPKASNKFSISNLMSPPEPVLDNFNQSSNAANGVTVDGKATSGHNPLPMSPPISPYSKTIQAAANASVTSPDHVIKDPVLYPVDESAPSSPPQPPLFAPIELENRNTQENIDRHLRARSVSIFDKILPPKREDYELALLFKTQVMKHYEINPRRWLDNERARLRADNKAIAQRYHPILPAKTVSGAKPARGQTNRVSKPQPAPRPARNSVSSGSSGGAVIPRPVKRISATPEPSRRIVAPNREDKDFDSIVDYCPPRNSLPTRPNSLKVDWKGQPIDLSGDPHASLLHPDEVLLAGNLRLDCATYLTSKRRIFERRLQCLRTGKEFRKTDAQQACKIDVNKASKLWTAFDKVGWLDAQWVRRFA